MLKIYLEKFIIPYWVLVLSGLVAFSLAAVAGLAAPLVIKTIIDDALGRNVLGYLHLIILVIVMLYLLRGGFSYLSNYAFAKAGNKMMAELRNSMFSKLQNADYSYFINTASGDITALFTNDLWLIYQAVSLVLLEIIIKNLNLLAITAILLYFNWRLAIITFITIPFIIAATVCFNKQIGCLGMMAENKMSKVI